MKKPVVSVDLLVVRRGKILLGKLAGKWSENSKYEWGLPGRAIQFADNFKETVKKNLKKELGMSLERFNIVSVNNNFGLGDHYVSIGIEVNAKGEPKVMNKDWKEWRWFDKSGIPDKLFPPAKLTVQSFLKNKISIE